MVLTSEMQLGVEGKLNAKAEASMKPHWTHNLKLGVKYDTDGWNQIYQNDLNYKNENNNACTFVKLDGSMTAGIAPWVKPSLYLYDSAGVTETVKLRGQADATFKTAAKGADHAAEATLKLSVIPSLQAGVHLKLPVTDKELLSHDFEEQKQTFTAFDNTKDPWKIGQCPVIEDPGKVTPPETKDVTVTFMDPRSGTSKALGRKAGDTLTLTQAYLERQLGLDSGSLDGIKDLNTAQDGSGKSVKLDSEWTVPDTDTTLYIQYGSDSAPDPTPTKATVKKVISDNWTTYAVKTDGTLWAWGDNSFGRLGVGDTEDRHSPVKVMDNVSTITAFNIENDGYYTWDSAFVVKVDGTLWAWGRNNHGQLGVGDTEDRYTPVKVMDNVSTIALGYRDSTYAVKTDGTLWAWGNNYWGQLGVGDTKNRYAPVKVMDNVSTITTNGGTAYVVKADGTLWAWGNNDYGRLGVGDVKNRYAPVKVADNVSTITASDYSVYVVKADGTLWAWGWDGYDDLGIDNNVSTDTPVKVTDNVSAFIHSVSSSFAVKTDGTLWAWGRNEYGQLGVGDTETRYVPVKVTDDVSAITTNGGTAFAVKTDGTLWAWGNNGWGQLGVGDTETRYVPVKVTDSVSAVAVDENGTFAYMVKTDGTLWAWGNNTYGQLGVGGGNQSSPVKVM